MLSPRPIENPWLRTASCWLYQRSRGLVCPDTPRLEGRVALVTGATSGIGAATARGLLARGATLVAPCRNLAKGRALATAMGDVSDRVLLAPVSLDDLATIPACVAAIAQQLDGLPIDILVENAGVWPRGYATTTQGHEIAFGTNVLGHFALRQALMQGGLLAPDARVVVVTGDIYALQQDCTPDYRYRGLLGGMYAYCRSKLGNLWIASELQRREPGLTVTAAHPGVVTSDLFGSSTGFFGRAKSLVMIDPEQGAQTSLYCATQPGLVRGGYYHSTRGLMQLRESDPGLSRERAAALWATCEALAVRDTPRRAASG